MSWESIQNALTSVGNKVKEAAQKAVAPIVNAVKTTVNTVANVAKQAVNTVKTAVQSTVSTVKTVAQSALTQAKQAVDTVKTVAKSAVQSAAKAATNVKSTAATWAETAAQKVANSINSKTSKVIETAQQKVKQTSAKTPTVQNNTFLNIINNTACRSINYSAAHELFLLFEENADLFGTGNEENHVPNKIFGDYLSYCGNNDDFITWEEYLDQRIEEDLNKQVIAFNGQHPTLAIRFYYEVYIDFYSWDNLREEVERTSQEYIVEKIMEKAQDKFYKGFNKELQLSEKEMKRIIQRGLKNYLSAYETGFLGRLINRPFPYYFTKQEDVRRIFGDIRFG